jgi:UDP:flavonoid glycosyltransferase YjiC (YdhE family)
MILFASAGSWGEVQPLLALAKHFDGAFACDEKWVPHANKYLATYSLCAAPAHDYSIAGFLEGLPFEEIFRSLLDLSIACKATAIVSPFYLLPAKIVAEMRGIPWIATTTSPIYFREIGAVSNARMMAVEKKLNMIRKAAGLPHSDSTLMPERVVGLYPAFLGESPFPVLGYPRLPPCEPVLSVAPVYPYCVISQGSIANHEAMYSVLAACRDMHLSAVYLGNGFSDSARCFGLPFSVHLDHVTLLRGANAAIIHGGIGTLCDAIEADVPIIVRPLYFDNFHNASELVKRGAKLWPALQGGRVDVKLETNRSIFSRFEEFLLERRNAA